MDKNLDGMIRESFLTNDEGIPALANKDASWQGVSKGAGKAWKVIFKGQEYERHHWRESQIALDGILLCGDPGRPEWRDKVEMRLGSYGNPDLWQSLSPRCAREFKTGNHTSPHSRYDLGLS